MEPQFVEIFGMQNLLVPDLEKIDLILKHDNSAKWICRKATGDFPVAQERPQPPEGQGAMMTGRAAELVTNGI